MATKEKTQTTPRGEKTPSNTKASTSMNPPRAKNPPSGLADREAAVERVKGKTSDARVKAKGTPAAEVPPDVTEGPKQSDAGAEQYPFPPAGDVEIATVPKVGEKSHKAEKMAPLDADTWVRLGKHKEVPEELVGHIAAVLDAPTVLCNCDFSPVTHEHPSPDAGVTVRTRDEHNTTLTLPLDAFSEIGRGGRAALASVR